MDNEVTSSAPTVGKADLPALDSVFSTLNYLLETDLYDREKPYFSNIPADDGTHTNQYTRPYGGVAFHNMRGHEQEFSLDVHGFQIVKSLQNNMVCNFDSDDWIQKEYYSVIKNMLKQTVGASRVEIFDHTVRTWLSWRPRASRSSNSSEVRKKQRAFSLDDEDKQWRQPSGSPHVGMQLFLDPHVLLCSALNDVRSNTVRWTEPRNTSHGK
jgi:hypothetical protein